MDTYKIYSTANNTISTITELHSYWLKGVLKSIVIWSFLRKHYSNSLKLAGPKKKEKCYLRQVC